jgi:hypothetical protein
MAAKRIVIVGSRHRGWKDNIPVRDQIGSETDREFITGLLKQRHADIPDGILVLSIGCDAGFGYMVRDITTALGIPFVEYFSKFTGHIPKIQYEYIHLGRHAALADVGEEFHVFITRSRFSNIEDLVVRLQIAKADVDVYDEECNVIE